MSSAILVLALVGIVWIAKGLIELTTRCCSRPEVAEPPAKNTYGVWWGNFWLESQLTKFSSEQLVNCCATLSGTSPGKPNKEFMVEYLMAQRTSTDGQLQFVHDLMVKDRELKPSPEDLVIKSSCSSFLGTATVPSRKKRS